MLFLVLLLFLQLDTNDANGQQFSMTLSKKRKEDTKLGVQMDVFGATVSSRYDNILYEGIISVGTPPKAFRVILDTGSAILWLPKAGCTNAGRMGEYCDKGEGTYDPKKSKTSKPTGKEFLIKYGIGQTTGHLYQDMFAFGNPVCNKQLKLKKPIVFGAGEEISDGDQGILGLGFARSDEPATSIFDQAVNEGVMTEPVFTVFYRACPYDQQECESAGSLTFGQIDTIHCGPQIGNVSLNRFALQWEFNLEKISSGSYVKKLGLDFITDSGASHIFLPYDVIDDLAKTIGATEDEEDSSYYISCKRRWQINFKIGDNDYVIKSKEMTLNLGNDKCKIAWARKAREPYVLGGPFLRSYCNIHYWKEKKLGFAKIKNV